MKFKKPDLKDFGPRELAEAGPHPSRIVGIVDLGIQENKQWNKLEPKALFIFSLTDDTLKEGEYSGKMKHVSKTFTQSTSEMSAFYKQMVVPLNLKLDEAGELADGGLQALLNMSVMVTIIHKDVTQVNKQSGKVEVVTYDNIAGLSLVHKSLIVPEADTEPYFYSLDAHDEEVFKKLPKWVQTKINFSGTNVPVKGGDFK
jgi:hypothetical protein